MMLRRVAPACLQPASFHDRSSRLKKSKNQKHSTRFWSICLYSLDDAETTQVIVLFVLVCSICLSPFHFQPSLCTTDLLLMDF